MVGRTAIPASLSQATRAQLERNILLFRWASFISGFIFIIPIWVLFEMRFLTVWQMAILEAVITAITLGLELPTGALADIFGRKFSVGVGWVLQGIGLVIQAFSIEPILFTVGFILAGIGLALVSGADSALLYDTLKELGRPADFQKEMSRCGLYQQLAIAAGTLMGGWLYQQWVGLPYVGYGLGMLVAGWLFFLMKEPDIDSETFSWQGYWRQFGQGWQEIKRTQWSYLVSWFYVLVGGITWSAQAFFNNTFLVELGFSPTQLSFMLGSIRILNSLVLFRLLHLEKILTVRRTFVFFAVLLLFAFLPGWWVQGWWIYPFMMAATLSSTARHIVLGQLCHDQFTSKNRATALSTLNMAVSLWYAGAMVVGGWVLTSFSARAAYASGGVIAAIVVVPLAAKLWLLAGKSNCK
jgi:MFS family permease